ncbi:hypothetical protein PHJA_002002600 [Phtheirospermum japonicum]|uniref:Uncharacterized protein n=1 Tax=Phtheirospermum japonicum TaxID=374723 RepID=A0A830CCV2_9LAMI|nr:hypothetical protein PHJA_002002600 [Phtheirospermum japonicum]
MGHKLAVLFGCVTCDPLLNLFKDVFPAESLLFDFRYLELNSFKHKRARLKYLKPLEDLLNFRNFYVYLAAGITVCVL